MPDVPEGPASGSSAGSAVAAASLDRGALERVLARAAELSMQSSTDAPEGMTEAQLLEIGKEVGLSATTLQQALAEERTRVVLVEETGLEARVIGPGAVSATRTLAHAPETILAALEDWLGREYRLLAKRRFGNRRTWEQRSGVFAELDRTLRGNAAAAALMRAGEVGATVSAVGDGRTVVRLDADLLQQRRQRRMSGGIIAGLGVVLSGVPVMIGAAVAPLTMLPLFVTFGAVPLLGLGAASWGYMKAHRKQAERTQLALEQLLDRLEHTLVARVSGGTTAPAIAETITAVALGVRDVARAMQDAAAKRGPR